MTGLKHWYVKVVGAVVAVAGFAAVSAGQAGAVIVASPIPGQAAVSYFPSLAPGAAASLARAAGSSSAGAPRASSPAFACSNLTPDCAVLTYHGGPVQHNMVEYFIYWDPSNFSGHYPAPFEAGMTTWLNDLAAASGTSGNVFAVANQYFDTASGPSNYIGYSITAGPPIVATDPLPANDCTDSGFSHCIIQPDLQTEIKHVVETNGLPENVNTEYTLLRPPGVADCSGSACLNTDYCAYHTAFVGSSGLIVYSNEPYLYGTTGCDGPGHFGIGYPNGPTDPYIDPTIGTESHELMESITDPVPPTGWFHGATNHEIGDECAYDYDGSHYGAPSGLPNNGNGDYNQVINGHQYIMQTEFSNANSNGTTTGCIPSTAPKATITGVTASPVAATPTAFSGSTSTDSSSEPLTYAWDFGDGTTSAGPTPSHSYAHSGTYKVKLAVEDTDHFIDTATTTITVANHPPIASFAQPAKVIVRSPASFNGSASSDPDGAVAAYAWNFGDGTTGTGAAPSHTFSKPGAKTVTLTVTDNQGASTPASQQVAVLPKSVSIKTTLVYSGGIAYLSVQNTNGFSVGGSVTLTAGGLGGSHAKRSVTVGHKKFSAKAKKKTTVKIKLSKAAQSYLSTHNRLKIKLALVTSAAGVSNAVSKSGSVKPGSPPTHGLFQPALFGF